MDLKSLEALGITKEDLTERIIDRAVNELMTSHGFDPESDSEVSYESEFKRAIDKRIQNAVDAKINAIAAQHLVPRVGEMIEQADMRRTNTYGEPKGPRMTFKEYIASRAESYMVEDVDFNCNSKADLEAKNESTYQWRSCGPRLMVMMRRYIADELEKNAKAAVTDVNKVIADNIKKAAVDAIHQAAANLKVSVQA